VCPQISRGEQTRYRPQRRHVTGCVDGRKMQ